MEIIIINPGCSNKCIFCRNTFCPTPSSFALRKQELKISRDLINYRNQGSISLNITGNDPLEYDKLLPMIEYLKQIGFIDIMLCTHLRVPLGHNIIKNLTDAGVNSFRVPIYEIGRAHV